MDPDKELSDSPLGLLFHWATLDLQYYRYLVAKMHLCPKAVLFESLFTVLAATFAIGRVLQSRYAEPFFLYWLLPSRIAVLFLGFAFDYLPHHDLPLERWQNTALIAFPPAQLLLGVVLFNQNYHIVHHTWPTIPFFRYVRAFDLKRAKFVAHKSQYRLLWNFTDLKPIEAAAQ